jgi:hypothetical protein
MNAWRMDAWACEHSSIEWIVLRWKWEGVEMCKSTRL